MSAHCPRALGAATLEAGGEGNDPLLTGLAVDHVEHQPLQGVGFTLLKSVENVRGQLVLG